LPDPLNTIVANSIRLPETLYVQNIERATSYDTYARLSNTKLTPPEDQWSFDFFRAHL